MGSVPPLLLFLLMMAAGWVHRHQLIVLSPCAARRNAELLLPQGSMITSFEILDRTGRERVDRIFGYYASETAADQEMECDLLRSGLRALGRPCRVKPVQSDLAYLGLAGSNVGA